MDKPQIKCPLCGASCGLDLTAHAKGIHGLSPAKFAKQWNAIDLWNGKSLKFSGSLEQHYLTLFSSKRNLKAWINKNGELAEDKFKELFLLYMRLKERTFAPAHVELKSIRCLPDVPTIEKWCGEGKYPSWLKKLDLNSVFFNYNSLNMSEIPKLSILTDTREQSPLKIIGASSTKQKLDYGDYALETGGSVFVERKSLGDFVGTLSAGYERFKREIGRAQENEHYLVVLIERDFMKYVRDHFCGRIHGKTSPDFIFHRMRTLMCEFAGSVQFLFCDGRREASRIVPILLYLDEKIKNTDLQYLLDQKKL